jgi:ParB family transcriptional regulator, chromosome partitioning protein
MKIEWIRIETIEPNQRCVCTVDSLERLADSIREQGQIEPLKIWFTGEGFRIIDGEKRWRVCKKLGLSKVKAVIVAIEG